MGYPNWASYALAVVVVVGLALHAPSLTAAPRPTREQLEEAAAISALAAKKYEAGQFVRAAELFHEALNLDPEFIAYLYSAARAEDRADQLDLAERDYQRFVEIAPRKHEKLGDAAKYLTAVRKKVAARKAEAVPPKPVEPPPIVPPEPAGSPQPAAPPPAEATAVAAPPRRVTEPGPSPAQGSPEPSAAATQGVHRAAPAMAAASPSSVPTWIATVAAVGLTGAGVSLIFAAVAQSHEANSAVITSVADVDAYERKFADAQSSWRNGAILAGAGAAAGIAALWLHLRRSSGTATSLSVSPAGVWVAAQF